jgi:hypothetical protein
VSDRTLPGIQPEPAKRSGSTKAIVGVVVTVSIALIVWVSVNSAGGSKSGYAPNNPAEATAQCEARIERLLKAPDTAKFDSSATGSGTWTVSGTVDSENGFGAMLRSEYQCTVVVQGEKLTTTVDFLR